MKIKGSEVEFLSNKKIIYIYRLSELLIHIFQ